MCVPFVPRLLEQCHDVESNPGPLRPGTNKSSSSSSSNSSTSYASMRRARQQHQQQQERQQRQQQQHSASLLDDGELEMGLGNSRVDRLEREMQGLQNLLTSLDTSVLELKESVEGMRPAYNQALQLLASSNLAPPGQKNNLVFHGIAPDALELQMESEPEFCRDVLETRIKMVFREHLRISRDMPLTQVYRVDLPDSDLSSNSDAPRPLVVGFKSLKDRDNILRHTNLLRKEGIFITEDTTGKRAPWMKPAGGGGGTGSPKKQQRKDGPSRSSGVAASKRNEAAALLESDHMSSCNSDYAPSSHSGNSSSGAFTDD